MQSGNDGPCYKCESLRESNERSAVAALKRKQHRFDSEKDAFELTIRRLRADKQSLKDDLAIVRMDRDGWQLATRKVGSDLYYVAERIMPGGESRQEATNQSWFDLEMQITNYLTDIGMPIYGVNIITDEDGE